MLLNALPLLLRHLLFNVRRAQLDSVLIVQSAQCVDRDLWSLRKSKIRQNYSFSERESCPGSQRRNVDEIRRLVLRDAHDLQLKGRALPSVLVLS